MFITRCVLKGDVSVKEGYRIRGGYFALFIGALGFTSPVLPGLPVVYPVGIRI